MYSVFFSHNRWIWLRIAIFGGDLRLTWCRKKQNADGVLSESECHRQCDARKVCWIFGQGIACSSGDIYGERTLSTVMLTVVVAEMMSEGAANGEEDTGLASSTRRHTNTPPSSLIQRRISARRSPQHRPLPFCFLTQRGGKVWND